MAIDTATIRIPLDTRKLLAEQARERGMSLSALVTDLARQAAQAAMFRAEQAATRRDAVDRSVRAEERDWETVLADGID